LFVSPQATVDVKRSLSLRRIKSSRCGRGTALRWRSYEYRVTSYGANGVESDLSSTLIVTANSQRVYLPLVRKN